MGIPVARSALGGVHRVAERAQPLHITAQGASADAETFGEFAPGPVAVGLQQGERLQQPPEVSSML